MQGEQVQSAGGGLEWLDPSRGNIVRAKSQLDDQKWCEVLLTPHEPHANSHPEWHPLTVKNRKLDDPFPKKTRTPPMCRPNLLCSQYASPGTRKLCGNTALESARRGGVSCQTPMVRKWLCLTYTGVRGLQSKTMMHLFKVWVLQIPHVSVRARWVWSGGSSSVHNATRVGREYVGGFLFGVTALR